MLRRSQDALIRLVVHLQTLSLRERGQTLTEYGLLVSLIAVSGMVMGLIAFRTPITGNFDAIASCLRGSC